MGYIYKYVYNDEIIYIGKTKRELSQRILEHEQELKFMPYLAGCKIFYFETATNVEMDIAEKYYINLYSPRLNIVDMEHASFNFVLPAQNWLVYEPVAYKMAQNANKINVPILSEHDKKKAELELSLQEKEQELVLLDNFKDWLEYMFDLWVNDNLDIRQNKVFYSWDLTSYPLPDYIALNGQNCGLWTRSECKDNGDYMNVMDLAVLQRFFTYGKASYKAEYIPIRAEVLDLEERLEKL